MEDKSSWKIINDSVHGHIKLHPLEVKFIDTPEFQRLRYLKQLGMASYVYPGGVHTRFEHSIGTSYLCRKLVRSLQKRQPDLKIDESDVLCVSLAGLLHDIGHGPFSHTFETFMRSPKAQCEPGASSSMSTSALTLDAQRKHQDSSSTTTTPSFRHEDLSLRMIELLLTRNSHLQALCKDYELDFSITEEDLPGGKRQRRLGKHLQFVEDLIEYKEKKVNPGDPLTSLYENKSFLFEIVANKWTGVDMDKFDYFARDALHLGMRVPIDCKRYIHQARAVPVSDDGGRLHICLPEKDALIIIELFQVRYSLHRRAYQHKVTVAYELMLLDSFASANDFLVYPSTASSNGKKFLSLSECASDTAAYFLLTDEILSTMRLAVHMPTQTAAEVTYGAGSAKETSGVEKAKQRVGALLERIARRQHYQCVASATCTRRCTELELLQFADQIALFANQLEEAPAAAVATASSPDLLCSTAAASSVSNPITTDDFVLSMAAFDMGMKENDPFERMRFYSKASPTQAFKLKRNQVSKMMASLEFSENQLRLYVRKLEYQSASGTSSANSFSVLLVKAFAKWCEEKLNHLVSELPRENTFDFVTPLTNKKDSPSACGSAKRELDSEASPEPRAPARRRLDLDDKE